MLKRLFAVMVLASIASLSACKTAQKKDEGENLTTSTAIDDSKIGDSDSGKAMGLQTVTFAYDSSSLTSESKEILKANAQILKDKASVKIQVEGHCDSRGGIQYNLALGEHRAAAVRSELESLGISGSRMTTISFGKERPLDPAETEAAYAKNRRANFAITSK